MIWSLCSVGAVATVTNKLKSASRTWHIEFHTFNYSVPLIAQSRADRCHIASQYLNCTSLDPKQLRQMQSETRQLMQLLYVSRLGTFFPVHWSLTSVFANNACRTTTLTVSPVVALAETYHFEKINQHHRRRIQHLSQRHVRAIECHKRNCPWISPRSDKRAFLHRKRSASTSASSALSGKSMPVDLDHVKHFFCTALIYKLCTL